MGRPSDKKRSARRPGKRERARVKNARPQFWTTVAGVGTVHVRYGRKKSKRFHDLIEANRKSIMLGNLLNPKILSFVKRPVYKTGDASHIQKDLP